MECHKGLIIAQLRRVVSLGRIGWLLKLLDVFLEGGKGLSKECPLFFWGGIKSWGFLFDGCNIGGF